MHNILRKITYLFSYTLNRIFHNKIDGFILCYHSISDDGWEFSVPENKFKNQIEYLLKNYEKCSPDDFRMYLKGQKKFSKPFFIITFDDGYENISKVSDYLTNLGIKPILFIMSNRENINRLEIASDLPLLNNAQILNLKKAGWEIGCHSATHADFSNLNKDTVVEEIKESKYDLETELGLEVKYFSYPKGRYNKQIVEAIQGAGYDMAFSMDSQILNPECNPFSIPRVGVMNSHSFVEFISMPLPISTKIRNLFFNGFKAAYE